MKIPRTAPLLQHAGWLVLFLIGSGPVRAQNDVLVQAQQDAVSSPAFLRTIRFLLQESTLEKLVRDHNLTEAFNSPDEKAAIRDLRQMVDLTEDRATNSIDISVLSEDPGLAAALTNDLAELAGVQAAEGGRVNETPSSASVAADLKQLEEIVDAARVAMMKGMKEHGIVDILAPGSGSENEPNAMGSAHPEYLRLKRAYEQRLAVLNLTRGEYLKTPSAEIPMAESALPGKLTPPGRDAGAEISPIDHLPEKGTGAVKPLKTSSVPSNAPREAPAPR